MIPNPIILFWNKYFEILINYVILRINQYINIFKQFILLIKIIQESKRNYLKKSQLI